MHVREGGGPALSLPSSSSAQQSHEYGQMAAWVMQEEKFGVFFSFAHSLEFICFSYIIFFYYYYFFFISVLLLLLFHLISCKNFYSFTYSYNVCVHISC